MKRDSQRSRLYSAERAAAHAYGWAFEEQTIANADLQAYVDALMARRGMASRWPRVRITVGMKRGGRALGYPLERRIMLPMWARNPWVVSHEVAHVLTGMGHSPMHGPAFAGVFLHVVGAALGPDARRALREAYKADRVRYNLAAVPEPGPAPVRVVKVAARSRPTPSPREMREAAEVLRRAVATGVFGPAGRKPRDHASATARALEAKATSR